MEADFGTKWVKLVLNGTHPWLLQASPHQNVLKSNLLKNPGFVPFTANLDILWVWIRHPCNGHILVSLVNAGVNKTKRWGWNGK